MTTTAFNNLLEVSLTISKRLFNSLKKTYDSKDYKSFIKKLYYKFRSTKSALKYAGKILNVSLYYIRKYLRDKDIPACHIQKRQNAIDAVRVASIWMAIRLGIDFIGQ